MAESNSERLERTIREQKQESFARAAIEETTRLEALNVNKELKSLNKELNSLTDKQLKAKDRDFLQQKLAKIKELEKEKSRRGN